MCPPTYPLGKQEGNLLSQGIDPPQPSGGGGTGEIPLYAVTLPDGHDMTGRSMCDRRELELLEKSQVVFVEETDVVNTVFQHCQTLGAHSKRETRIRLRIVADEAIQGRIHHP